MYYLQLYVHNGNNLIISRILVLLAEYEIDQINPRGPRKGRASHRTTHSAWVRGWAEYIYIYIVAY
jgi:hypothetical protein